MKRQAHTRAVLTDSHFLIPAAVFLAGITLLVLMH
ncbi:MAG TPA: translocated intimin receptor Tir [Terracidiphilus sp.]